MSQAQGLLRAASILGGAHGTAQGTKLSAVGNMIRQLEDVNAGKTRYCIPSMAKPRGQAGISLPSKAVPYFGTKKKTSLIEDIRVFEECVAKELKHLKFTPVYQLHPSHVPVITEKASLHNPHEKKVFREEYSDIIKKVENTVQPSIRKLSFPQTSSQEVGWIIAKELEKGTRWRPDGSTTNIKRPDSEDYWYTPRRTCDIVKYGKFYVSLMHKNMFHS